MAESVMMTLRVMCWGMILGLGLSAGGASLQATFEKGPDADRAEGRPACLGARGEPAPGKGGGQALRTPKGGAVYAAENNISLREGTVSFDFQPSWNGDDNRVHVLFAVYTGDPKNYLQISKLGARSGNANTLGGAFVVNGRCTYIGEHDGSRLPVAHWKKGEWHRIELAYDAGRYYFRVDGRDTFTGERLPFASEPGAKTRIVLGESGGDVFDNLTIEPVCRFRFEAPTAAGALPEAAVVFLDEATPYGADRPAAVGWNALPTSLGPLPLQLDGQYYAWGIAAHAPNRITYRTGKKFDRFQALIGINDSAGLRGSVLFKVLGDGRELFRRYQTRTDAPFPVSVDIRGVDRLTLVTSDGADDFCDHSVWVDALVARRDAVVPPPSRVAESPVKRRQSGVATADAAALEEEAYRFRGEDLTARAGEAQVLFAAGNVLDAFDPAAPRSFAPQGELSGFAAPDEFETLGVVLGAPAELTGVTVEMTPLRQDSGMEIPPDRVELLYGMRMRESLRYDRPTEQYLVTTRFLRRWQQQSLRAGHFRELFVRIAVPEDQAPGRYRAELRVRDGGGRQLAALPVDFEVLPVKLRLPDDKWFGMYYDMNRVRHDDTAFRAEIRDLLEHQVTMLFCGDYLKPAFQVQPDGSCRPDFTTMDAGIDKLVDAGFRGKLVVSCELGEVIGLFYEMNGVAGRAAAAAEALKNPEYLRLAVDVMNGIRALQRKYPQVELIITTMDEVFNHGRLPLYLAGVKAARQVPGFQYYITFHFLDERADRMRQELAPYVDYRCHHMLSWEWYLARGNTAEAYQQELDRYGSVAGAYYNPVGAYYSPAWYRLIMGLEFVEGPLSFQMPWMYYSCLLDPFTFPDNHGSHIFGFYSAADGEVVSARIWEGYREGMDDLRYLSTLKALIREQAAARPELAAEAAAFVRATLDGMPKSQGLPNGPALRGDPLECPWTGKLAQEYDYQRLQQIRRRCAEYIAGLQQKG